MADTIKMTIILLSISILLYFGQVSLGDTFFREDLLTQWVAKDSTTGELSGYSDGVSNNADSISNPSTVSSGATSSFLSFWDITQIIWGFVKLMFNIFFAIPMSLLLLDFPTAIKMLIIVPLIIIAFNVITLGIFGRR